MQAPQVRPSRPLVASIWLPCAWLCCSLIAPATAQKPGKASGEATDASADKSTAGKSTANTAQSDAELRARRSVPVFWEPSLDVALARAKRLGRPVMIAVHKPSEKASSNFLKKIYPAALVRPLLRELVCVAASTEATAPLTGGPRKGMSVAFRTVTSTEAQATTLAVGSRYLGDEISKLPVHVFVDAEGHLIRSVKGALKQRDFIKLVQGILDKSDPFWRPPSSVLGAKASKGSDLDAAPFAGLFSDDLKAQGRAVEALLASTDKTIVAGIFAQIPSAAAKSKLLESARRRSGDKSWMTDLLELAIADRDPSVRAQAAVTAEAAKLPALLPKLLSAYKGEKDADARSEMLRALAASARGDKRVWSALGSAVKDRSERARAMAYVAYARFGESSDKLASRAVDVLVRRGLRDRDSDAKNAAVWALGHLRSKRAGREIEKLLKKTRRGKTKRFYEKVLDRIRGKTVSDWESTRRAVARESVRR